MSFFDGGIGGVAGGIGSIFAGLENARAQKAANKANMQLAQYQFDKNLEQWNRENEYNSPRAQMQRYKDANLNPNLIYGQQNLSANSPSYGAPQIAPVTGRAQGLVNGINMMAQMAQMALDLKHKQLENQSLLVANNSAGIDLINKQEVNDQYLENLKRKYDVEGLDWQMRLNQFPAEAEARRKRLEFEAENFAVQKENAVDMMTARLANLWSSTAANKSSAAWRNGLLEYQKNYLTAQTTAALLGGYLRRTEFENKDTWQGLKLPFNMGTFRQAVDGLKSLWHSIF